MSSHPFFLQARPHAGHPGCCTLATPSLCWGRLPSAHRLPPCTPSLWWGSLRPVLCGGASCTPCSVVGTPVPLLCGGAPAPHLHDGAPCTPCVVGSPEPHTLWWGPPCRTLRWEVAKRVTHFCVCGGNRPPLTQNAWGGRRQGLEWARVWPRPAWATRSRGRSSQSWHRRSQATAYDGQLRLDGSDLLLGLQ